MRVTLRQLEIVHAVAESRSVSAAARQLNLSQPAVTRYLRDIEQSQGVVLFARSPRGTVPTAAGLTFLHRARAVSAELRALEDDVRALRGSFGGRLAIGVTPAATSMVPRVIASLLEWAPEVAVELIEDMRPKLLPALRAGELDLVLATQTSDGPGDGLVDRVLCYNRLSVVAGWKHPLGGQRAIPAAVLRDYTWVLPPPDLPPRKQLETAFHQARVPFPRRIVTMSSVRMMRELLLCGDFLSVMLRDAVDHDLRLRTMRILDVELVMPVRPIALLTRRNPEMSPASRRFLELLAEALDRDGNAEAEAAGSAS